MCRIPFIAAYTLFVGSFDFSAAGATEHPKIANLARTWEHRAASVRRIIMTLDGVLIAPKGSFPVPNSTEATPGTDISMKYRCSLILDLANNKTRYTQVGGIWDGAAGRFSKDKTYETAFDSEKDKAFYSSTNESYPTGFIEQMDTLRRIAEVRPVITLYRGLDRQSRLDLNRVQVRGEAAISGRDCVIVAQEDPDSLGATEEWWVDEDNDFVVRRYRWLDENDRVMMQWDCSYKKDPAAWVPSEWRVVSSNPGGAPGLTREFRVGEYQINPTLSQADFEFDFPVGTWVTDARNGKDWIVRPNDEKRYVTGPEHGPAVTYEDLLESESGHAIPRLERSPIRLVLVWITGCAVVIFTVAAILRRRLKIGSLK